MRIIMLLLAAAVTTWVFGAAPARAEITYPWCAQYGGTDGGGTNCGFVTIDQCRATVSGMNGYCYQNPMYVLAAPRLRR
jgi:hypothetical protein